VVQNSSDGSTSAMGLRIRSISATLHVLVLPGAWSIRSDRFLLPPLGRGAGVKANITNLRIVL
jgi:hypothetical protein